MRKYVAFLSICLRKQNENCRNCTIDTLVLLDTFIKKYKIILVVV